MLRAAIYTRISRDLTGEGAGVARQEDDCRALAAARGLDVTAVFSDNDISAYSGKRRPAYQELLASIAAGEVDVVVCWHTDRLYRRVNELEDYIVACQARDVPTYAVQAGHLDLATPAGRMTARTLGAVAQYESEHKSERQRRANLQRALDGKHFGSRRCFGYEMDGVTIRADEAAAIRDAYGSLLDGTMSLADVARDWASRGLTTPQAGNAWDSSTVSLTLRTARLAGIRSYHREILIDRETGEPVTGKWPPIIDLETWAAVKALLATHRAPPANSPALLAGVAQCAVCDAHVHSGGVLKGRRRYACSTGAHINREAAPIENFVESAVLARLTAPGFREMLDGKAPDDSDVPMLRHRIAELRRRSDGLVDAYADGSVTELQLRRGQNKISDDVAELESRIPVPPAIRPVLRLVGATPNYDGESMRNRWEALPLGEKRAVIHALMIILIHPTGGKERAYLDDYRTREVNPDTITIVFRPTPAAPLQPGRFRTVKRGGRRDAVCLDRCSARRKIATTSSGMGGAAATSAAMWSSMICRAVRVSFTSVLMRRIRGNSAELLVSWRQTCPQPVHRYRRTVTSSTVGRHPNGSWASRRSSVPRGTPSQPQLRHQSSGSTTRHGNTARVGSSRCPTTTRPSSSRRVNVVRSGPVKVAFGMSRSSGRSCENLHHRKTSTLTPAPTRRPPRTGSPDRHYTLVCDQ